MKRLLKYFFIWLVFFSTNYSLIRCHFRTVGLQSVIQSDAIGYYEYLPYFFIKHDIAHQDYAYRLENGNTLNKYTSGVAILLSPFFGISHLYNINTQNSSNIFAPIYGHGVAVAASFYLALGLLFLFFSLTRLFKTTTAILSIMVVYLGTNLYYYSTMEPGMSHVYSFFCFSGFLFTLQYFLRKPSVLNTCFLATFLSLAVLIRPTSLVLIILLFLYEVYTIKDLVSRFSLLFNNKLIIPTFILIGFMIFTPQLLYWHKTTGNFVVFSYGYNNEGFTYWKNPQIIPSLFGIVCGWLPFTPIMFMFLVGCPILIIKKKNSGIAILTVFVCILYLCSSWWAYNFSCAFGYRSFVEYYPIFIIPITFLIQLLLKRKAIFYYPFTIVTLFFFIALNIKMTYKFEAWLWCTNNFTWEKYFQVINHIFHG